MRQIKMCQILPHDKVNIDKTKVDIGKFPTPLTKEDDLAAAYLDDKISLFIKHEGINHDEIGAGVKIRQIEYLFAYAKSQGYTHLVIDGVIDSHCCSAISHYAPRYGLQAVLVIKDEKAERIPATHQKMIDSLADIYYMGKNSEPEKVRQTKQKIAEQYSSRGAKPLIVPTGATNELTILGCIDIAKEIVTYEAEHEVKFDYIILPVGTGGVHFGLEIGRRIFETSWKITGIIIDDNTPYFYQQRFLELGNLFIKLNSLNADILKEQLWLHEHRGKGYGLFEQDDINNIERIYSQHGIYFDPTYNYKCFKGLQELITQLLRF